MNQLAAGAPHNCGGPTLWVTTSWDDGYPLDIRLAELLDRYGVEGTFYVPIRSQLPVMDSVAIRELARRFDIGGHTVNHQRLTQLNPEEARREIFESKQRLEGITGRRCAVFCPPGGQYSLGHLRHIHQAGYAGLRTVELMSVAYPSTCEGLVMLPATLQLYPHQASTYLKNACKRGRWNNLQTFFRHVRLRDLVQTSEALLESLLSAGGVFHLWGHSWELEHSRLWEALEMILKHLQVHRDRCRFVSNQALCEQFRPSVSLNASQQYRKLSEVNSRMECLPR